MNQNNNNMENNTTITIESLIEQGNDILRGIKSVPAPAGVTRIMSTYSLADKNQYESWKNIVIRFLSSEYPGDYSINEFKKVSTQFMLYRNSPNYLRQMIGILESIKAIPSKINDVTEVKQGENPSIIINNSNTQTQKQVFSIDLFSKAIEDVLTVSQIKELKKVVEEEDGDVAKAKPKLIEKLKSFGENLSSNIVANILTNPTIWSSIF